MRCARVLAALAVVLLATGTARGDDEVAVLRDGGQHSVDALHAKLADAPAEERQALEAQLDRVCAQRDCSASRLFWYTDLEEAKAAARRLRRPIVSLHLLGRLDEEVSCANSRFFRVMLYSDPAIASVLRDDFVMHWHSVRPVPRITIDLGNGRTIRQTITGNSVHYLLDYDGTPLDALAGLYSPKEFTTRLEQWTTWFRKLRQYDRISAIRGYHMGRAMQTGILAAGLGIAGVSEEWTPARKANAYEAARRAGTKSLIEGPVLQQVELGVRVDVPRRLYELGEQSIDSVQFSEPSLALMRRKQELTPELLHNLRRSVAADTLFNEYELHRRLHVWYAYGEVMTLEKLNDRVYAELFLTPTGDPWMGLQPNSVFAALKE
ncbi:MAG TPA: hypothetical protein VEK57_21370 [Thermoanaerobaculia bacterium]|nr:hypothetical protein [Thermoanaerobaculia bacterium]